MKKKNTSKHLPKLRNIFKEHIPFFTPELIVFTFALLFFVFLFICFSVYLHPDGEHFSYHFTSEQGAITILSASLLSMSALLAYACVFVRSTASKRQRIFFLIVAIGLTYLATDEVMHFHEQLGDYLDTFRNLRHIDHELHIRAWNDTIIIIYGLLAIPLLIYFLPTAAKIPCIPEYFSASFLCYVIHTSIDAFVDPFTISFIIEESFKVYTSAFLVLGLVSGLIYIVKHQRPPKKAIPE